MSTAQPAIRIIGVDKFYGDFKALVVDGDPSVDIKTLHNVDVVMRSGSILVKKGEIIGNGSRMISDPNNPPHGPFPPE
ncbi:MULTISPECIES: hypothetical protein [unclassified Mesorhizobium]|uniref:hypothetical protein n=1 Tax=unclassified Mesorhizobium TaxID=325217 RepID=UPI0010922CFA|nr:MULTISPECIES: hypothetical protein [unclassified Mesorhizobium]TGS43752.1 hypothetical protein EN825_17075 [Mesorhizobium sp. M8A.F.Ca.ET.182.01.1.1]TGS78333.1 hypothetical protein EN824_26540 [Mesorhizobium sp. M8A.F.Ca.ET.181.01.1.1]TGV15471.1 hypothetical protein EN816_08735 [Mesorhizobium sp. M8A.F.Ca.ET.173.01.1.1]